MMDGGAVSWKSVNPSLTVIFTMQDEYIAVHHKATKQALWLRNLIMKIKVVDSIKRPLRIFCDNSVSLVVRE